MYSVGQIFKQEPAAIVSLIALGNAVALAFNAYSMTEAQLGAVVALVSAFLTLAYVRPLTASKDALNQLAPPDK